MEKIVDIWFLTDHTESNEVIDSIGMIGINITRVTTIAKADIISTRINVLVVDLKKQKLSEIMAIIRSDERIADCQKYVILDESDVKTALELSSNVLNADFIGRPLNKREFIILLEKTVFVEKYREMMKTFSRDMGDRLEAYQSLVKIHNQYPFESSIQKKALEKIIRYEKNLIDEQKNLNDAIHEFTNCHQQSITEMKGQIDAGEMLEGLRKKELMDADGTIKAQQSVIEFSALEVAEREKILEAQERTSEFSREEAMRLHDKIIQLTKENEALKKELAQYKK